MAQSRFAIALLTWPVQVSPAGGTIRISGIVADTASKPNPLDLVRDGAC
jgi:hypothetical protein